MLYNQLKKALLELRSEGKTDIKLSGKGVTKEVLQREYDKLTKSEATESELNQEEITEKGRTFIKDTFCGDCDTLIETIASHHNNDETKIKENVDKLTYSKYLQDWEIDKVKQIVTTFLKINGISRLKYLKKIVSKGNTGTSSKSNKSINIGNNFSTRRILHELGHHLEFTSESIRKCSEEWRLSRAYSNEILYLQDIMEKHGLINGFYCKGLFFAKCLEGDYSNPYTGRIYPNGYTEVLSTGFERFYNTSSLANFHNTDPSHFYFLIGTCISNIR